MGGDCEVRVRLLHGGEELLPAYQTEGSAGMDLKAAVDEDVVIPPMGRALVRTGVAISLPPGVEGQVRPRSGLAIRHGVTCLNSPGTIERTIDKYYTSSLLERAGLPTPETIVCESYEGAFEAWRALGGDVIVKPLFGSMGLGMSRVTDEDLAWRVFRVVETVRGVYYLQRTVPHQGRDVRVFVVGEKVLGAMERRAPGWRTNFSRGGKASPIELPAAWGELAIRAAALVGAEYAGVDLLPADDGTVYVLEVNGIPGWEGLQQATGIDVAGAILDQLIR